MEKEMERTSVVPKLNRDGYSKTFSIPRALMALPLLSSREKIIVSKIISLSSKYLDKGGCNLSNEVLARRHRCSKPVVSNAIAKANWLGLLRNREDTKETYKNERGDTAYVQNRRLILTIPEIWEFFGEVWGEFYFNGSEAAEIMLDWLEEQLKAESALGESKLDIKRFVERLHQQFCTEEGLERLAIKISNGGILKSLCRHFEIFMTPIGNLYASYVLGHKFSDISLWNNSAKKQSTSNSLSLEKVLEYFPEEWSKDKSFQKIIKSFLQHRKEINKPLKPQSTQLLANKLGKVDIQTAMQAITTSVENGWTGVFPEKSSSNGNGSGRCAARSRDSSNTRERNPNLRLSDPPRPADIHVTQNF